MEGTFWSLLPPFIAILLCFLTKNVILSLFMGVFTGGLLLSGFNPFSAISYSLDKIIGSIADDWNAKLLLFNLLMGAGIALIWKLGGSLALSEWAKKRIKSKRSANIITWLLGIIVFFNDYINAAIVGNVSRDIYEKNKMPREKLSYILDSTSAPVATFFISDWIAYQLSMIQTGMETAGITGISPLKAFIGSIPFNFYCILTILFVGLIAITNWDYGPMLKAEIRASKEGKTFRDGATPMLNVDFELGDPITKKPLILSFILPIIALIVVTLWGFYYTGAKQGGNTLLEKLGNSDAATALLWGAFAMVITGIILSIVLKLMNINELMKTFVNGLKLMLIACTILVLAWSIGSVAKELELSKYVTSLVKETTPFSFIPAIIFFICMIISFATGTSWGTMAIMTPIAISLAYKISNNPLISVTVMTGTVFAGAIFGDHCSPISDTTVLSSIFSGSDHMDHVNTQIPYSITVASVSFMMFLLYGFFKINPFILLPFGFATLIILAKIFNNYSIKKI